MFVMQTFQNITPADFRRICELHVMTLPTSSLSAFSLRSLETVYKFAVISKLEQIFIERDDSGKIIAAAFVSLAPSSFLKRLMMGSTFLLWFLLGLNKNVYRLIVEKLFETKTEKHPLLPGDEMPELMFIFSDPEVRSQGCGQQLLAQIEAYFSERKVTDYEVRTEDKEDNRALSFYERNEFKKDRRCQRMGNTFQVFRKHLRSSTL